MISKLTNGALVVESDTKEEEQISRGAVEQRLGSLDNNMAELKEKFDSAFGTELTTIDGDLA